MKKQTPKNPIVPLEKLTEKPYSLILCYPNPNKKELEKRILELKKLGVKALEFTGKKQISNLHILGKGCVGIVVIAHTKNEKAALKIRRTDASRENMRHEAEMLEKANSIRIGPKLLNITDNFLLMEYIEGMLLPEWLQKARNKKEIKKVLRMLLEQCWKLDQIGLDHGELSQALKHIIIDKNQKPHIVDFETASDKRKPANLTSITQFLFIKSQIARITREKLELKNLNQEKLIRTLRKYKKKKEEKIFNEILRICKLSA